jgi:hypothetical protein
VGYKVLGNTEQLFQGYTKRPGLEGPFLRGCSRIVYYDPKEGKYWDPKTDFYLTDDEIRQLDEELARMMSR